MDLTLQRQRGHFVEMEMSACSNREYVKIRRYHRPVRVQRLSWARWRKRARNISRSLPSLQDQRSRSREAYFAEPLKYASPTAFTCRDTQCGYVTCNASLQSNATVLVAPTYPKFKSRGTLPRTTLRKCKRGRISPWDVEGAHRHCDFTRQRGAHPGVWCARSARAPNISTRNKTTLSIWEIDITARNIDFYWL